MPTNLMLTRQCSSPFRLATTRTKSYTLLLNPALNLHHTNPTLHLRRVLVADSSGQSNQENSAVVCGSSSTPADDASTKHADPAADQQDEQAPRKQHATSDDWADGVEEEWQQDPHHNRGGRNSWPIQHAVVCSQPHPCAACQHFALALHYWLLELAAHVSACCANGGPA